MNEGTPTASVVRKIAIASALEAKAQVLYTEDMQERRIGNLWIVNPFS